MAITVLIRRCVKKGKEQEFLASYSRDKPRHPDFISETLTKVSERTDLPSQMVDFPLRCKECTTYINVAQWKTADAFIEHMKPQRTHNPDFECEDRVRIVLEVL
jgi:hypothetical protein